MSTKIDVLLVPIRRWLDTEPIHFTRRRAMQAEMWILFSCSKEDELFACICLSTVIWSGSCIIDTRLRWGFGPEIREAQREFHELRRAEIAGKWWNIPLPFPCLPSFVGRNLKKLQWRSFSRVFYHTWLKRRKTITLPFEVICSGLLKNA